MVCLASSCCSAAEDLLNAQVCCEAACAALLLCRPLCSVAAVQAKCASEVKTQAAEGKHTASSKLQALFSVFGAVSGSA